MAVTIEQESTFANHTLGHFRLGITGSPGVALQVQTPPDVIAALAAPADAKNRARIVDHYVRDIAPELVADRAALVALRKELDTLAPVRCRFIANSRRTSGGRRASNSAAIISRSATK